MEFNLYTQRSFIIINVRKRYGHVKLITSFSFFSPFLFYVPPHRGTVFPDNRLRKKLSYTSCCFFIFFLLFHRPAQAGRKRTPFRTWNVRYKFLHLITSCFFHFFSFFSFFPPGRIFRAGWFFSEKFAPVPCELRAKTV